MHNRDINRYLDNEIRRTVRIDLSRGERFGIKMDDHKNFGIHATYNSHKSKLQYMQLDDPVPSWRYITVESSVILRARFTRLRRIKT